MRILLSFSFLVFGFQLLAQNSTKRIHIDQFGYLPDSRKIAVISNPQQGFNSDESFTPGQTYEIRKASDNTAIYSGSPEAWNEGNTHQQSGDKGWWFDFSSVTTPGTYYIYDTEKNVRSYKFEIAEDVYLDVLKAAVRMYFYNRCGFAKETPYADPKWTDNAAFVGANQDTEARYVHDKDNASTAKEMSGGWFDAGDYNKYVTFAQPVIHQLLDAYTQNKPIWGDDYNIPESGNGIPDIIDEIKWELDWLKKMQDTDGGVYIKLGVTEYNETSPPSNNDGIPRYYGPKCSSSSIAAASMFAHAAIVLKEFSSLQSYANDLEQRAIKAWDWYSSNSRSTSCDNGEIKSGDADRSLDEQDAIAVSAAVYLFALTQDEAYNTFVQDNYNKIEVIKNNWWGPYSISEADALLYYTTLSGADNTVKSDILNKKNNSANSYDFYQFNETDLYRAFMPDFSYHWGSNSSKANYGNINYDMITYNLDPNNHETYSQRTEEILHFFHGVNPMTMVMLSNMYEYGAENSANEIYHTWFWDGTDYDHALNSSKGPAPGYLVGGPNKDFTVSSVSPPYNQPPQKSYKDWNTAWPENSWEVTEPAIYYQSAYIKLLSKFVSQEVDCNGDMGGTAIVDSCGACAGGNTGKEPETDPQKCITSIEQNAKRISIYPNPASDKIWMELNYMTGIVKLVVINATGAMIHQNVIHNNRHTVDISKWSKGVYFVKLQDQSSNWAFKVVKH